MGRGNSKIVPKPQRQLVKLIALFVLILLLWKLFYGYSTDVTPEVINPYIYEEALGSNNSALTAQCVWSKTERPFRCCLHPYEKDWFVSGSIQKNGWFERPIVDKLATVARSFKNVAFLDIGAHIGFHSLHMASMGYRVVSIEPSPHNIKLLIRSILLNSFQDRTTVLNCAISNSDAIVNMTNSANNQGITYLENEGIRNYVKHGTNVFFPTQTILLSSLVPLFSSDESVIIKIDVEAHECEAFATAQKFLTQVHVPYIFMEWMHTDKMDPGCLQTMIDTLLSLDYRPEDMEGHRLRLGELKENKKLIDIIWRLTKDT